MIRDLGISLQLHWRNEKCPRNKITIWKWEWIVRLVAAAFSFLVWWLSCVLQLFWGISSITLKKNHGRGTFCVQLCIYSWRFEFATGSDEYGLNSDLSITESEICHVVSRTKLQKALYTWSHKKLPYFHIAWIIIYHSIWYINASTEYLILRDKKIFEQILITIHNT